MSVRTGGRGVAWEGWELWGMRGAFVLRPGPSGYSTELALWKGVQSLVLGAPRHQHTGKVVIFIQESRQWRPKAEVTGTQVGYGGSQSGT